MRRVRRPSKASKAVLMFLLKNFGGSGKLVFKYEVRKLFRPSLWLFSFINVSNERLMIVKTLQIFKS